MKGRFGGGRAVYPNFNYGRIAGPFSHGSKSGRATWIDFSPAPALPRARFGESGAATAPAHPAGKAPRGLNFAIRSTHCFMGQDRFQGVRTDQKERSHTIFLPFGNCHKMRKNGRFSSRTTSFSSFLTEKDLIAYHWLSFKRCVLTSLVLNAGTSSPTNRQCLQHFQPPSFLDLKQIKQIIDLMKRSELSEFAVEEEGFKLKIRRGTNGLPVVSSSKGSNSPFVPAESHSMPPIPPPAQLHSTTSTPPMPTEEAGIAYIKSPMVGTFYRSSSPESKPFVDVGAKIEDNTLVCIIEAMKIMNEIQAETKGTVVEILIENGQPVEYGQRLFKLRQG
jgi:acetyl-CoA carboxylase biotin carboxyl carrier protein